MSRTETEFGARGVGKNTFYPPPHALPAKEKLRSIYLTGDDTGLNEIEPAVFQGLLPFKEQVTLREAEGAFEKGQYDPKKDL